MKNTLRQILRSPKFIIGFIIFGLILCMAYIYPLINPGDPMEMIGLGTFFKPGTYISVYDAIDTTPEILDLKDAADKRLYSKLKDEDRVSMMLWLTAVGVPEADIDLQDTTSLLKLWKEKYDPKIKPQGMTKAQRNAYERLNNSLITITDKASVTIADKNEDGTLVESKTIKNTDYVNISDVANVIFLPLGTDNFGRDVLKELVAAIRSSLFVGLIAGLIATLIGLSLGLLAGFLGGTVDDGIMFVTNLFTVIPGFVLLILITYSVGETARSSATVAIVIGITSWVWTARAVRSQVISLRNRDHVNLSKLSGHSLVQIILQDILPYIASYVVMALILQISTAILAEAQLSLLGLGPSTTKETTLGMMMNWAMLYSAHTNGSWWAYMPILMTIALISFSLNLMNTGLDQVFNPTLRD
jgi:peptide/nickel transport system permease protein